MKHSREEEIPSENPKRDFEVSTKEFHVRIQWIAWLEIIKNPSEWPYPRLLCMRNDKKSMAYGPKLGVLYQRGDGKVFPIVYCVNVLDIGRSVTSEEQLLALSQDQYGSFEEMLQDGWVID